jgi:hypothetical protein
MSADRAALNIRPATKHMKQFLLWSALVALALSTKAWSQPSTYEPLQWTKFVKVEGQSEPVPEQWLATEEGRIAHSLKLPDSVPKTVAFDFDKAAWRAWKPGTPKVAVQYFKHLCATEAGEWIFKKVKDVEGFYFARPIVKVLDTDFMKDPFGPEMPWLERLGLITADKLPDQGEMFISQPTSNYRFVEQPQRDVGWQAGINEPYVRLFGYTREIFVKEGQVVADWNERTPMQVKGITELSVRYGYTWRGIKRAKDRENGIAGGEALIYDLQTKQLVAARRQFLIGFRNPRGAGAILWEIAASCPLSDRSGSQEFREFAFSVLQTIEPSTTYPKK